MPVHKKTIILITLIATATLLSLFCKMEHPKTAELAKAHFEQELKALQLIVSQKLLKAVEQKNEKEIKNSFLQSRLQYKSIEYYIEYFFPSTSTLLNGAPIDEIELGENLIENPTGFQVMEELIYEEPSTKNRLELLNEVKKMQLNLERMLRFNEQYILTDAQLFDAARLEIFRINSLGITGFDNPIVLQSIPEAAASLKGIHDLLSIYGDQPSQASIQKAIQYLNIHSSFNQLNRIDFITDHLQFISQQIDALRKKLQVPVAVSGSALRDEAINMFEQNAFNINKFVGNASAFISNDKIMLGKILFNDPILSKKGNRSCSSCHHQAEAFTDGLPKASALAPGKYLLRNTPTLNYAGLQRGFFYDLKAGTLEDQALDVVHHKEEMDGSLTQATSKINASKKYRVLFKKAYKETDGQANPWKIQHALATYIRSLAPFSSRLDLYMRGDKKQLNEEEKTGFNIFMGKAKCGTCHFAPLFNGTQSPLFIKSEAEVLGVPVNPDTVHNKIDPDLGRFALYAYPQYKYSFKTPTLRNISKTAPYMHNGVYQTLDQVVDFYNRGGGAGLGIHLDNQTLPESKLGLTTKEIKALIAFMKTLDDQ